MKSNPECKRCGLLKSTVYGLAPFGPNCSKLDPKIKHNFGEEISHPTTE